MVCPVTAATFDVRTGEALTLPAVMPAHTFEVTSKATDIHRGVSTALRGRREIIARVAVSALALLGFAIAAFVITSSAGMRVRACARFRDDFGLGLQAPGLHLARDDRGVPHISARERPRSHFCTGVRRRLRSALSNGFLRRVHARSTRCNLRCRRRSNRRGGADNTGSRDGRKSQWRTARSVVSRFAGCV